MVLADYDMNKGYRARQQLCHKSNIRLMKCDLRSFESVRQFARLYDEEQDKLDVLLRLVHIEVSQYANLNH